MKKSAAEPEQIVDDLNEFEDFEGFDSTDDEVSEVEIADSENQKAKKQIGELASKATKDVSKSDTSAVVYIGRIPHGFYEEEVRSYFGQFGTITKLRISRNKKTGASKHFGFIEFANKEVAKIVCETMNNYLLFGHLLKVNMLDSSQIHPELWVGANRKYHAVPWGLVNKQRLERKHPREWWENKQKEFESSKKAKAQELAELGITY